MFTVSSMSRAERYNTFFMAHPILVALTLLLIVVALRAVELFFLNVDTLSNQTIVSKVVGILLVLGYLQIVRQPIRSIGLHATHFGKAILTGGGSLLILYVILYGTHFYRLTLMGESPQLVLGAINQETGVIGDNLFTMVYVFGQVLNAFMEEMIFRGLMLPYLMRRFRFWKANMLQALLFGLAHLIFPLSTWLSGHITAGEALAEAIPLLIATTVGGLVFGYLYYRTNSLWAPIFTHLIDNSIGLFFHIQTVSKVNAETDILILASVGFIALMFLTWTIAKHFNLSPLHPWSEG